MLIAGVDEVGRGPLAGPVVAAAVILNPNNPIEGLRDSKRLSEKKREILVLQIKEKAFCYAYGRAEFHEIDEINILQASLLAMQRAVDGLKILPHEVWVDGQFTPKIAYPCRAIIGGDASEPAISAASILAKVKRDHEMIAMDNKYPGYGFAQHKGYPTKAHLDALTKIGISPIHRRSFGPVKSIIRIGGGED